MRKRLAVMAFTLAAVMGPAAWAVEVNLDGDRLDLALPQDFCALDPARTLDAALLRQAQEGQQHAGGHRVLVMALPCRDLPRVRQGSLMVFPWFSWISLDRDGGPRRLHPATRRIAVLDSLQDHIPKVDAHAVHDDVGRILADSGPRLDARASFLVDRDTAAVYSTVLTIKDDAWRTARTRNIVGTTVLKSRPLNAHLNAHLNAPHHGGPSYAALVATMKAVMADSVRRNDPQAPR